MPIAITSKKRWWRQLMSALKSLFWSVLLSCALLCAFAPFGATEMLTFVVAETEDGIKPPTKWQVVRGSEVPKILSAIGDETRANFEKIETWKGTYDVRMRQVLSSAFVASNFAESFKGRAVPSLRQEFIYSLGFALDVKQNSLFWDKQTSKMVFVETETNKAVEIPNARPSDG